MMQKAQESGSVAILLTALLLVQRLGAKSKNLRRVGRPNSADVQTQNATELNSTNTDKEISVFDNKRVARVCSLIYSLIGKRECTAACAVGISLYLRSLCDVRMVHLITSVESSIVNTNPNAFRRSLTDFMIFMAPVSALNAILNYSMNELALCMRETLSNRFLDLYMQNETFYRINQPSNFASRSELLQGHAWDQAITHDVEEFTFAVAKLFSHVIKPAVDVCNFSYQLHHSFGASAPAGLGAYMIISGILLSILRGPHGQFSSGEQLAEGAYRATVSRVNTHSEQIASLGGAGFELKAMRSRLNDLISYVRSFAQFRACMAILDGVAAKYFLSYLGWILIADPFLKDKVTSTSSNGIQNKESSATSTMRYEHYHIVARMMTNLSSAVGSLVLSGRDVVRCLGLGWRLATFEDRLRSTQEFASEQEPVVESLRSSESECVTSNLFSNTLASTQVASITLTDVAINSNPGSSECALSANPLESDLQKDALLVHSMSLVITRGNNLLITGTNGSGKSSLLRVISGLWQPQHGHVVYSGCSRKDVFYLPQSPYMPVGTLREQIMYPGIVGYSHSGIDNPNDPRQNALLPMSLDSTRDDKLMCDLLKKVCLTHLLTSENDATALNVVRDWSAVLSGGEKQRLSMARLYYHRPLFAFLDECTSAVSVEVEETLYKECQGLGITLVTVSHKPGIRSFHATELRLIGDGTFALTSIM